VYGAEDPVHPADVNVPVNCTDFAALALRSVTLAAVFAGVPPLDGIGSNVLLVLLK
jgi:hypothetical protein